MNKKFYAPPVMDVFQVKTDDIICTSNEPEAQNETYEEGNTSGWFNQR